MALSWETAEDSKKLIVIEQNLAVVFIHFALLGNCIKQSWIPGVKIWRIKLLKISFKTFQNFFVTKSCHGYSMNQEWHSKRHFLFKYENLYKYELRSPVLAFTIADCGQKLLFLVWRFKFRFKSNKNFAMEIKSILIKVI